jgi:hypothetical protein
LYKEGGSENNPEEEVKEDNDLSEELKLRNTKLENFWSAYDLLNE